MHRYELEALMEGHDLPTTLAEIVQRPAWMADAACRGADTAMFFPARGEDTRPAKQLCDVCPVRGDCLALGLEPVVGYPSAGVWGGTSARERRTLRAAVERPARTPPRRRRLAA